MRAGVVGIWLVAAAAMATPTGLVCSVAPMGPYHIPRAFTGEIVSIECSDGYHLAADFIRRQRQPRKLPGVIYLHEGARDRHSWYPLTIQSAGRGMAVLAIDLRGFGENPDQVGNAHVSATGLSDADWLKMLDDVRNAISFLAIKPDIDAGHLAIVGSGIGANLALLAGAQSWAESVRCVIAISPETADHGLAVLPAVGAIARGKFVYLAAAKDDPDSDQLCAAVMAKLKSKKEFLNPPQGGHGVKLFGQGLFQKIPLWLYGAVIKPSQDEQPLAGMPSAPRKKR